MASSYLIKAGHIAVLTEAVITGHVPASPIQYGKERVKERFLETHVYWAVDHLVSSAVRQIQRSLARIGGVLDFIPGRSVITQLASYFVELSLGYIDECCLGYSFYRKDQGAFQSACDGVVLYAQNANALLKNAAMTMLKVVLLILGMTFLIFLLMKALFHIFHWSSFIAFALSCFITWIIKFSFIDSYILCTTISRYMELSSQTTVQFDLYGKLSGVSASFRKLWHQGQQEKTA